MICSLPACPRHLINVTREVKSQRSLHSPVFLILLILAAVTFSGAHSGAAAQAGEWALRNGGSMIPGPYGVTGQPPIYGIKGVADSSNNPGGRQSSATWTGDGGNLWLFGGNGYNPADKFRYFNDLWEFNLSSREWTWVAGSSQPSRAGVYGSMGAFAPQNTPGARFGMVTWTDATGKFWLFGGFGYDASGVIGNLNDLWSFDPSIRQWAWINGGSAANRPGLYGNLRVPAPGNVPGSRYFAVSWVGGDGNLWVSGGVGFDSTTSGGARLNDLWKFDLSTHQWTWIAGGATGGNSGIYGTRRVPAQANVPGSRFGASTWTDSSGNLWLFGGDGLDRTGVCCSLLDDLWKFDLQTNEWTWVAGQSLANTNNLKQNGRIGIYRTLGVPAVGNSPGSRVSTVTWTDHNGKFWLFGGNGYDSVGGDSALNDLWIFDPAITQWAWIGGSSTGTINHQQGVYGSSGVPAPGNIPGGRLFSVSWLDNNGSFWLYGGRGFYPNSPDGLGLTSDLWHYDPPAVSAAPEFLQEPGKYIGSATVALRSTTAGSSIHYTLDGSIPSSTSTLYTHPIALSASAAVRAISEAAGYLQSPLSDGEFTVVEQTAAPVISPASGTYSLGQTVVITDAGPATIRYTTDGSIPTARSRLYTGPFRLTGPATINATAISTDKAQSQVVSVTYSIP